MILKILKKNGRIRQLLGASVLVALVCFYSSYSLAYTQQYNVGDTGPNGGTVTSSTVTSVVTNTEVTLNGGFEDTTTTTQWTETVVEEIATSTTTTQQVSQITATTTSNFVPTINSADWSTTGRIKLIGETQCRTSGSSQTVGADEACTGYMNNTNNSFVANTNNHNFLSLGGGETQSEMFEMSLDMTAAEIQAGFTLNYGVDVQSHKSNVNVPLCSATNGDCKDVFRITTKLFSGPAAWDHSGSGLIAEFSESVTLTYHGTQTHSFTGTVGANNYTEVWGAMELWGVDAGYHGGYYGPVFSNPFMTLTYDTITTITQTITQIILSDQTTVYNTSEDTVTSVFIGDPTTDTTIPEIDFTEVESFEIAIVNEDTGGGIEMEFSVEVDETTNVATVEMETTNMDTGIVAIDTIVEIDLNLDFGSMDTGPMDVNMPSVESIEADVGSQIDTAVADAVAEIEIDLPDMSTDTTQMADAGPVVEMTPPSDAGPNSEPTVEVEVNTTETSNETNTQETVSETESTESPEAVEPTSETVQESSQDVEQPVEESASEPEGSDSGDTESGEDTSGTETESDSSDSGDAESSDGESNDSSSRGEKSDGKSGNDSKSKSKSKQKEKKSNSEKKKEYVEKKVAEAKQKIATKILSAMADTYNAINETTKIALISSLADTKNFQAYLDKQNALPQDWYTSEQVYQDMPQLLDPASVLYNMAQDKIMDEMIMMQYE
jgi:hypothetical protein